MKIETKYNIGDEVWYMESNKACSRIIKAIRVTSYGKINIVEYGYLNHPECGDERTHWLEYHECRLFPTKEELLKSL